MTVRGSARTSLVESRDHALLTHYRNWKQFAGCKAGSNNGFDSTFFQTTFRQFYRDFSVTAHKNSSTFTLYSISIDQLCQRGFRGALFWALRGRRRQLQIKLYLDKSAQISLSEEGANRLRQHGLNGQPEMEKCSSEVGWNAGCQTCFHSPDSSQR
jgi:hypothetical protein